MSKTEVISQNSENGLKSANFWAIKAKKIPDSEFLQGFGYSNTLEGTKEKVLGSFQPKLMSKFEVISKNRSKYWIFGHSGNFLTVFFGQKGQKLNFQLFYWNIFYPTYALPSAKYQKKTNVGVPKYRR